MGQSKSSATRKVRRKLSQEKPAVYLAVAHPEYFEEEKAFCVRCLGARPPGRADKQAAAFYKAVDVFLQTGDAALPEFLRLGGWDDLLSAVLNFQAKLPVHPRSFQIARTLAALRHRAQGPKDAGRDQAIKILCAAGKALMPPLRGKKEEIRVEDPQDVVWQYYKILFRCEQAATLLKETEHLPGCRRWQSRLAAVCEIYDLPDDPQWWGWGRKEQVLRQLLNARMFASHGTISRRLRTLPRGAVLGFVVILDYRASTSGSWSEALRPQGTRVALGGAEVELPAIPALGSHPGAGRRPARTTQLRPRVVKGESRGLK
jgi:hypothetical protein